MAAASLAADEPMTVLGPLVVWGAAAPLPQAENKSAAATNRGTTCRDLNA
jgi:hypothetical protein